MRHVGAAVASVWKAGRRRATLNIRVSLPRLTVAQPSLNVYGRSFLTSRRRLQVNQPPADGTTEASQQPSPAQEHPSGDKESEHSHRAIGKAQGLFISLPESPGTPFVLPHGVRLARKLERVVRDLYDVHGYNEVISPQLYKKELWVKSGHWDNYREDMFAVQGFTEGDQREAQAVSEERGGSCSAHDHNHGDPSSSESAFGLKPMNCPGHCLIFASTPKTIRDLPIRFAEFSPLHRNEASGALSGLTRVRRFHQDDAHVFCAVSQVKSEIESMLVMLQNAYNLFGFPQFELALSTRPENYIGSVDEWADAENQLRDALDSSGMPWQLNESDGAFYGPKIDVRLIDAMGRRHQTATIQLDFQLPQRFDLKYEDPRASSGEGWARPVMIHRAILGSVERFMAILIESRKGNWPFWMNPRQAVVIPVTIQNPALVDYAERVKTHLALGEDFVEYHKSLRDNVAASSSQLISPPPRPSQVFHVDVDAGEERFQKRIRTASTVTKHSFALVVGEEELANGTVNVRYRDLAAEGNTPVEEPKPKGKKKLLKEKKLREQGLLPPESEVVNPPRTVQSEDHRKIRLRQATLAETLNGKDLGTWKLQDLRELFEKMDSWHL